MPVFNSIENLITTSSERIFFRVLCKKKTLRRKEIQIAFAISSTEKMSVKIILKDLKSEKELREE